MGFVGFKMQEVQQVRLFQGLGFRVLGNLGFVALTVEGFRGLRDGGFSCFQASCDVWFRGFAGGHDECGLQGAFRV